MSKRSIDPTAAGQVELVIHKLDSLSMLPSVAAGLFAKLTEPQFSSTELADIIESDAALTANLLWLISKEGLDLGDENFSIQRGLDKLAAHLVRETIFSIKVIDADRAKELRRKQLTLHGLAVGCCAEDIAESMPAQINPQLAYTAGLLHDIGKFVLDEELPKSFALIVEEAKSKGVSACVIEQEQLGLDHTILGKRLAQRWGFSEQIALAIWLHHNNTTAIFEKIPEAKIAQVVQLADLIARQCNIGESGSFDTPDLPEILVKSLSIEAGQLQQIRQGLSERVNQKAKVLGLDLPGAEGAYGKVLRSTISQLGRDNTKLSEENRQLRIGSEHLGFITNFLASIDSAVSPIAIAENFAIRWQKFYQTGMVCLYLAPSLDSQILQAAVVENLSQSKIVFVNAPAGSPLIPKAIQNEFEILNASGHLDWLFEQLDADFNLSITKLVPLQVGGKTIGVIAFELRYPADIDLLREKFEKTASAAGAILELARVRHREQEFAEQLARLSSEPETSEQAPASVDALDLLVEMAAGAAHELNNPLSVISGQSQLLAKNETDAEKKRTLKKIGENSRKLSVIIDGLMYFARPQEPQPVQTNIKQLLDEAILLAAQKQKLEKLDVQIDISGTGENVFVDSSQLASAIANILCNSVESYTEKVGPIKIVAKSDNSDFVRLQISDQGCGMDAETVVKATQPFFSKKQAGRKRGMGLAHAQRVIEINGGSLNITSERGSGSIVTILLPCR